MQTRNQFLEALVPLAKLPEGTDEECAICSEDFVEPVEICLKHIFCHSCIVKWLTRQGRTSCPTCRRELFVSSDSDRTMGANSMQTVAQALERSRLLNGDFDEYGYTVWSISSVQRATAATNSYLVDENHQMSTESGARVDMQSVGPHLIAMGNLLRECARATGRPYSGYQKRDWKIILDRLRTILQSMNGQTVKGDDLVNLVKDLRLATILSLQAEKLDFVSSRFFLLDAPLESPSGDLTFLINYIIFQCKLDCDRREIERAAHRQAQQEALQQESSVVGYALRWTGQRVFGGL